MGGPNGQIGTDSRHMRDDDAVTSEPFHQEGDNQSPAPSLSVRVETHGTAVVLHVAGEIDLVTAPELGDSINNAMSERPAAIVVDLTDVDFLASAGMAVLMGCHQLANDTSFRVVAAGSTTFRPMELTGMTEEISIYPTLDQALAGD
jgi:anti-sigma B factor antagonist